MSDDQLDDLKQYFGSRLSQTEGRLEDKIENVRQELKDEIDQKVDSLRQVTVEGFAGVGEAIETIHTRDDALEARVTTLEQKAA